MDKSPEICDLVEKLRLQLGPGVFDILDYWPSDPHTIGIARPGEEEPCVCVVTAGKMPGRYDLEHRGKLFRDCLIDGVAWAVRHELRAQRQTERGAASRWEHEP